MRKLPLFFTPTSGLNKFNFPTNSGLYFNLLKKEVKGYSVNAYGNNPAGCRDVLCGGLVNARLSTNDFLSKGLGAILIGGQLHYGVGPSKITDEKIKRVVEVINYAEEQLKVPIKTKIYPSDKDNYYIARVDKYWLMRTYLLSLWALLVRIALRADSQVTIHGTQYTTPDKWLVEYEGDFWGKIYNSRKNYERFVKDGTYLTGDNNNAYFGINGLTIPASYEPMKMK